MSDGLFSGKWNPKNSPLEVVLIASNPTEESQLNAILKDLDKFTSTKKKDYKFSVSTIAPTGDFVIINKPKTIDMDYMVKIYNYSALSSSGVYRKVTYNGNVVLDYLPTHESVEAEQIIKSLGAIKSTPGIKLPANLSSSAGCADLVEAFLQNY